MSNDDIRKKFRDHMNQPADPQQGANKFLEFFFADTVSEEEPFDHIRRFVNKNILAKKSVERDLAALEALLEMELEENALKDLVLYAAMYPLDDPSDETARQWLETIVQQTHEILDSL